MNIGKTLLGTIAASLIATTVLSTSIATYVTFFNPDNEMLSPEDVLTISPLIFVVVFFLGSWPGVVFTQLLRLHRLNDFRASAWAGFGNGLLWGAVVTGL